MAERRRTRWRTFRAWTAGALALALAVPSCAWLAAPLDWRIDLVGNLAAQTLAIVLPATLTWTIARCRFAVIVGWLSVALLCWPLATGRAPRASASKPDFKVLVFNALVASKPSEERLRVVQECGADIVVLLEPPERMIDAAHNGGAFRERYPYAAFREWQWEPLNSYQVLMSRWPVSRPDGKPLEETFTGVIEVVVETPRGRVGVVAIHPRSPRTRARWRQGLDEADLAAAAVERLAAAGLPVIVVGDLNSTPSGLLSRRLRSAGSLRRCKPWLTRTGTFPADRPWPARVALDDVMVSRGFTVTFWGRLDPAGSDHTPVLVGLVMPPARAR